MKTVPAGVRIPSKETLPIPVKRDMLSLASTFCHYHNIAATTMVSPRIANWIKNE